MKRWPHFHHIVHAAHTKTFHTTHGVAHVAYFVAVMAEGHGLYAVLGGVMVVFSFLTVLTGSES